MHTLSKDPTEFTGIESYVAEMYEKEDISWVPIMKALCLDRRKKRDEEDAESR